MFNSSEPTRPTKDVQTCELKKRNERQQWKIKRPFNRRYHLIFYTGFRSFINFTTRDARLPSVLRLYFIRLPNTFLLCAGRRSVVGFQRVLFTISPHTKLGSPNFFPIIGFTVQAIIKVIHTLSPSPDTRQLVRFGN